MTTQLEKCKNTGCATTCSSVWFQDQWQLVQYTVNYNSKQL